MAKLINKKRKKERKKENGKVSDFMCFYKFIKTHVVVVNNKFWPKLVKLKEVMLLGLETEGEEGDDENENANSETMLFVFASNRIHENVSQSVSQSVSR